MELLRNVMKCNSEQFKIGQKYKLKPPESQTPVDAAGYEAVRQEAALRLRRRLTSREALASARDRSRWQLQIRVRERRYIPAGDDVVRKGVSIAPFRRRARRLQDRRESIPV